MKASEEASVRGDVGRGHVVIRACGRVQRMASKQALRQLGFGSLEKERWWGTECVGEHLMVSISIRRGIYGPVVHLQVGAAESDVEPGRASCRIMVCRWAIRRVEQVEVLGRDEVFCHEADMVGGGGR